MSARPLPQLCFLGALAACTGSAPRSTPFDPSPRELPRELETRVLAPGEVAIEAAADLFVEDLLVTIARGGPRDFVRYTLDGSEPSSTSTVYRGPFLLRDSAVVRACVFDGERPRALAAARTFTRVTPRPAFQPAGRRAGIWCEHFGGEFSAFPTFAELEPNARYIVPVLALPNGPPEANVARRFTGFVQVPRTAVWEFALASDDGAKLFVDDTCVIDDSELHEKRELRGHIALARGAHTLRVEWFNRAGAAHLGVRWAEAGHALLPIPASELGRAPPLVDEEGNVIEVEPFETSESMPDESAPATETPASETTPSAKPAPDAPAPEPKPTDAPPKH